jgi:hypothetical protein
MAKIKIFIVFHKVLDERLNLQIFSPKELSEWFSPYAVNAQIMPKHFINLRGEKINLDHHLELIQEYQLPLYDPELQRRGFMETSCYVHLLTNRIYDNYDYIGVCQYDMGWTNRSAQIIRKIAKSNTLLQRWLLKIQKPSIYCQVAARKCGVGSQFHPMASASKFDWAYLMKSYNHYFGTQFRLEDIRNSKLTLWQTYVLPKAYFIELAGWLKVLCNEVYPWANQLPFETHWGVLGGLTERAEALFMALREQCGEVRLKKLYLEHDEAIPLALGVKKNHYHTSNEANVQD